MTQFVLCTLQAVLPVASHRNPSRTLLETWHPRTTLPRPPTPLQTATRQVMRAAIHAVCGRDAGSPAAARQLAVWGFTCHLTLATPSNPVLPPCPLCSLPSVPMTTTAAAPAAVPAAAALRLCRSGRSRPAAAARPAREGSQAGTLGERCLPSRLAPLAGRGYTPEARPASPCPQPWAVPWPAGCAHPRPQFPWLAAPHPQLKTSPKAKAMFKGMEEGSFWGFVLKS